MRSSQRLAMLMVCAAAAPASNAFDYSFSDDIQLNVKSNFSVGAAWRTQERDDALIGKLNIEGQQDLCREDNCISLSGDPEPNARLIAARGAFSGVNLDNGNLNYDKWDMVTGVSKLNVDAKLTVGPALFRAQALGFYDPVNADFNERHPDTSLQPFKTKRPSVITRETSRGYKLLNIYGAYGFDIGDRSFTLTAGQQTIRWGEALLVALNSVSELTPPNANILHIPGAEISEYFQPVPAVTLAGDIAEGVTGELVYQFGWKRVIPEASGTFFSDIDLIGGDYAAISLGQFGEDPNQQGRVGGSLGLVSSTSTSIRLSPANTPRNGGQYGARLNYSAEWLNGGTELSLYYLNYHSRLPTASLISTDESCVGDATSLAEALDNCNGFNGSLPLPQTNPAAPRGEPLPIDTLKAFLDYPENIQMYAMSFTTNVGKFSLAGEYSFRPNQPLQVQLTDVIFAGLQPAFPRNNIPRGGPIAIPPAPIPLPTDDLQDLGNSDLPSGPKAIPSFLVNYRGIGPVQPNTLIRGYERMKVSQFDLTAIRAVSQNPFGADQLLFITEAGFTYVHDMPDINVLQFQGSNVNATHFGPGADGSAFTPENSCGFGANPADPNDPRNYTCHLNPTQQTKGFATAFSWGIREIIRGEYNDAIFGWAIKPTIILQWDVNGIAPFPIQNFVQGRKQIDFGLDFVMTQALSSRINYQVYFGGEKAVNTKADRDNIALSFIYNF